MVYIEIITKIVVCFYEGMVRTHVVCFIIQQWLVQLGILYFILPTALWTRQSHGQIIGGATPGKIVMGIRILYVEAVVPLDPVPPVDINLNQLNHTPLRALVFPGNGMEFNFSLRHMKIWKCSRIQSRFQKGTPPGIGQKFADGSTVSILFCDVLLSQQSNQLRYYDENNCCRGKSIAGTKTTIIDFRLWKCGLVRV